ncbi:glycosyltransferase family 2 protein [Confluentibacter citreus]|uniref:glycosyltransferase family 2 protein n=1 Tax=Confluentibacter citreus TaxID=2007307 RepID=UPI000C291F67|nr:glycosyltransferase family 2 protein [Confluentibacter citreus]
MNIKPLVSIVIPTYNRAHLIGETLNSVLAQTYTNWECIVVDDGSTDTTKEVMQEYLRKDVRFQYHQRPEEHVSGGNGARNFGFKLSKGEYVQWFDDDDVMDKDKLKIQMWSLMKSEFNFSVCQNLVFENNKGAILGLRHKNIVSENTLFDYIKQNIVFLTPSAVYKKQFLKINDLLFDEELKASQEWEFICRILYYSPSYQVEHTPLVYIRKHTESISYNDNYILRKQHYYLARIKVFQFLLRKGIIDLNRELRDFFRTYFVSNFKVLLFEDKKKAMSLYRDSIKPLYKPIENFKLILYINFVILTNRGYAFRDRFIK